jgi:YVTN family beta-propeller protein
VRLLDTRDGAVLGSINVGRSGPVAVGVDDQTQRAFVLCGARSGRMPGTVSVLDARSGAVLDTVRVGWLPSGLAVDAPSGRVFVANSGSDSVSVLNARSGAMLDTVPVGLRPTALAVDEAAGRVVVLTADATSVSILEARGGRVQEIMRLAQGVTAAEASTGVLAVDPRSGRAFVATGHETSVRVLDVRTGALLLTLAVDDHPVAVAVDERTGRAVVATFAGARREPTAWWENAMQRLRTWSPWLPPVVEDMHATPGSVSVLDPGGL